MYGWMMSDDMALVRDYARNHSEEAFAALVSRHIRVVYSGCRCARSVIRIWHRK